MFIPAALREHLVFRPLSEFFDFSNFSVPKMEILMDRTSTNAIYFAGNYLALSTLFAGYLCVAHPSFLIVVASMIGGAIYLQKESAQLWNPLASRPFGLQELQSLYITGAALLFFFIGGGPAIRAALVWIGTCLCHAAFRQRSLKSKTTAALAEAKSSIRSELQDAAQSFSSALGSGTSSMKQRLAAAQQQQQNSRYD